MPTYKILPSSTRQMVIVDITHDDGTFRGSVGFKLDYRDADDLKAQLDAAVLENQATHYAIKARAASVKTADVLVGKTYTVDTAQIPAPVVTKPL